MLVFIGITLFIIWFFLIVDNELSKPVVNLALIEQEETIQQIRNNFDVQYVLESSPCSSEYQHKVFKKHIN